MRIFLAIFLSCALFFPSGGVKAESGCDSSVLVSHNVLAWRAGQRDMEAAEGIMGTTEDIVQQPPFGVLQYSCFINTLSKMSGDYQAQKIITPFVNNNFSDYLCAGMNDMWPVLKCKEFDDVAVFIGLDTFASYEDMLASNTRGPECKAADTARTNRWNLFAKLAQPEPGDKGAVDVVDTYVDRMTWSAASNCNAYKPVPTGVIVEGDGAPYEEKTCYIPGCYFDPVSHAVKSDDRCR